MLDAGEGRRMNIWQCRETRGARKHSLPASPWLGQGGSAWARAWNSMTSACRILAMMSRIGRVRVVHTGQDAVAGGRAMSGRQGSEQSAGALDFSSGGLSSERRTQMLTEFIKMESGTASDRPQFAASRL